MADNDLPDNVIPITSLRINHDKNKKCTCMSRQFEVDTQNKEILCTECGVVVPPYDAMLELALNAGALNREVQGLYEQRKKLIDWKPHLVPLRELDRIYRGGSMLPCCPHCDRGILAHELKRHLVNRDIEMERRKFEAELKEIITSDE